MQKTIYTKNSNILVGRLRELRKKSGLNQRQLAKKLDVPRGTIARIELGERRIDVIEYFQYLEALDVDPKTEFKYLADLLSKANLGTRKRPNKDAPK